MEKSENMCKKRIKFSHKSRLLFYGFELYWQFFNDLALLLLLSVGEKGLVTVEGSWY